MFILIIIFLYNLTLIILHMVTVLKILFPVVALLVVNFPLTLLLFPQVPVRMFHLRALLRLRMIFKVILVALQRRLVVV